MRCCATPISPRSEIRRATSPIVEYFDYQCPYCKKAAPELAQVVAEDGKVKLVLKDWPIFGPASTYAARMALAAKYQDKYEAAHEALIAAKAKLTEAAVDDLLGKAGVDVPRASADRDAHLAEIDALSRATTPKPAPSASRARRASSSAPSACPAR